MKKWLLHAILLMMVCVGTVGFAQEVETEPEDPLAFLSDYFISANHVWAEKLDALEAGGNKPMYIWGDALPPNYDPDSSQRKPALYLYMPEPSDDHPKGCVIVCAGGAFRCKSDYEGFPVAQFFANNGFAAAVLDYRIAPYKLEDSTADLQQAIRLLRANASEYNIDPDKIAVCGFSAGGILAMAASYYPPAYGDTVYSDQNCIPNALILGYGVYGPESYADVITSDSPVVFMWSSIQDAMLNPQDNLTYASLLAANSVRYELHLWADGEHGIGMGSNEYGSPFNYEHAANWGPLAVEWLGLMWAEDQDTGN